MMKKCLLISLLFIGCARQIAPSGGPDDKTPPSVRYTVPMIGTIRYPVKGTITFAFSEWIDKKTAGKCLSIFPLPPSGIAIKVAGKTIELRPVKAFADSTTYHVELNTALNDLHGNSIGTPFHFFFSTGPSIDSGKVFGCVPTFERGPTLPKAVLIARTVSFIDSNYFGTPSYLVQTDSSGAFIFDHIRKGAYSLIAFIDANNDNRLQPGIERAFAPIEQAISLDSVAGPFVLYPIATDTTANRILSLNPISGLVIAGAWARPADTMVSSIVQEWRIKRLDTMRSQCAIKAYHTIPHSPRFMLSLTDTLSKTSYRLFYGRPSHPEPGKTAFVRDSIRFDGTRSIDTVRPKVLGFFPRGTSDLKPRIKLVWSKPAAPNCAAWTMADSLGDTVPVSMGTSLSDTTYVYLQRALQPGRLYRLRFPDTLFWDVSGNHPRDSTFGNYTVQTITSDNICYSLSGGASCLKKNNRAKWLFMPFGADDYYVVNDSCGRFRFDSIPGGKGRLGRFIDDNSDGQPTNGNLVPWTPPEPYMLFPDTIEARARWDIEGIDVPACEACAKKKAPRDSVGPAMPRKTGNHNLKD